MIKNILLDCGGVVYEIDYEKSYNAFRELSSKPEIFKDISIQKFKHIANEYEIGKQSTTDFIKDIREKLYLTNATNEQIINAWNAMLGKFIPKSIDFINKIGNNYQTALFSNTNELHYLEFAGACQKLMTRLDYVHFSYDIGDKKPNLSSFQKVLELCNFKAEETLFVDDSLENIQAAKQFGMLTIYYDKNWNFDKLLDYLNTINDAKI